MKRILFLCMGNICRSPAAHSVFQHLVDSAKCSERYLIDSAGTIDYHRGSPPDGRMQDALRKRKIPIIGQSRPLTNEDLKLFDLILAMDKANFNDARSLDRDGLGQKKIQLFAEYCSDPHLSEIPDPYYGYGDGFETVLDMIEEGCENLFRNLENATSEKA
ncbi:MAG: protein tyrosine phosphatase [Puniceicoccaceae bacterium]|nr:protein tyrosine phosphatase [Puniceicoccaceae bacterium]|tara:strand:- start:50 stop:532 length:483 start_codon:yes stop_codon:yes gene_type:complete